MEITCVVGCGEREDRKIYDDNICLIRELFRKDRPFIGDQFLVLKHRPHLTMKVTEIIDTLFDDSNLMVYCKFPISINDEIMDELIRNGWRIR